MSDLTGQIFELHPTGNFGAKGPTIAPGTVVRVLGPFDIYASRATGGSRRDSWTVADAFHAALLPEHELKLYFADRDELIECMTP